MTNLCNKILKNYFIVHKNLILWSATFTNEICHVEKDQMKLIKNNFRKEVSSQNLNTKRDS